MKKRIAPIALSVCAIALAAVFAVSCSSEFEPAWKASGGKATLSIRLGKPASPSATPRLIVQNGGYLYIQTGHDEGTAVLYGPWKVSAGDTFTTTDIPAGSYSAMHLIYTAEPLPGPEPIIPMIDITFADMLGDYLADFSMTLDSVSLATITDVTIIEGTTNVLKATLLPATTRYVNASEPLPAAHRFTDSPDSRERLFIQLTNTSSGIDIYKRLASLNLTIHNDSGSFSASLFYVALYRADGSFVSGQQISPSTIPAGGDRDITLPYSGATPDRLFLYVEYQGSEMQLTAINRDIQELPQYEYFVSDGGEGTGRTAVDTCSLETAIASIQDAAYITAATPATIYLQNDITVTPDPAYAITRPTRITSAAGGPYSITIGSGMVSYIPLFLVDHESQNPTLTIDNLTVRGQLTISAAEGGLIQIGRGSCVLGANAMLSNNVANITDRGGAVSLTNAASNLVMNSGASITGCTSERGGGVHLAAGSFAIRGGSLSGCKASTYGAGIYMSGGSLSIEDGFIDGNETYTSGWGGGLYMDGGSCTMTGGTIGNEGKPNKATMGAGVFVTNASFIFRGGKIWNNTTLADNTANGAGVYIIGVGLTTTFSMPAGSTGQISRNTITRAGSAEGGGAGLCVYGGSAQVTLYGGTIGGAALDDGNNAGINADGGGVYIYGGVVTLSGTRIQNNTARNGGGVYILDDGRLILLPGIPAASISRNNASTQGGGLYKAQNAGLEYTGVNLGSVILDNTALNDPEYYLQY